MSISVKQPKHEFVIDINKYLIDNFPSLSWKQRNAVGTLCEQDPDFCFDQIYKQIDKWVETYSLQRSLLTDPPNDTEVTPVP